MENFIKENKEKFDKVRIIFFDENNMIIYICETYSNKCLKKNGKFYKIFSDDFPKSYKNVEVSLFNRDNIYYSKVF